MVITMLEAQVDPEKVSRLENEFNQAVKELDPGLLQTLLVRATKDPGLWRIISVWESRQALDAMRQAAGAQPVLSVFEVVSEGKV